MSCQQKGECMRTAHLGFQVAMNGATTQFKADVAYAKGEFANHLGGSLFNPGVVVAATELFRQRIKTANSVFDGNRMQAKAIHQRALDACDTIYC